jgi:hypothetical protein
MVLVLFALIFYVSTENGTLVVEAMSSSRYSTSVPMQVPVTVGSVHGTTPFNLSLAQGQYTVVYGAVSWFRTPPPRTLQLTGGKTTYALAEYLPVIRAMSISNNGFNSTSVSAYHGVTPVVWLNQGATVAVLQIDTVGNVIVNPSQNYTHVFDSKGTFGFDIFNTGFNGVVKSV